MSYTPAIPPYEHQIKAIQHAQQHPNPARVNENVFAWLMEMGTGKTKTDIDEFGYMWDYREVDDYMIIAPAGVYRNWEGELRRHLDPELAARAQVVSWVSGGNKRQRQAVTDLLTNPTDPGRPRILLMNVEALSTVKEAREVAKTFLSQRKSKLTIDESTIIKTHDAKRTKFIVRELGDLAPVRRIATGSPTTGNPLDLFSQFEFLDWRILGFKSYFAFRGRYAVMQSKQFGGRSVQVVVGHRNLEELAEKIRPYSFRVLKEDCLDLPPKVYMPIREVELTSEQERIYEELTEFATAELAGSFVTTQSVITRMLRLHQILCGHVKDELGNIHPVPSKRLPALMDYLEQCQGKVIIWATYQYSLEEIHDAIAKAYGPQSVVSYWGETRARDRMGNVEAFQHDPACRFFVGNPSVGGYGITLTAASHVVYYSNSFNLEHRIQSEDRAHRAGLQHTVTYTDLASRDTMDVKIIKALREKIDIASLINGDNYKEWLI